MVLADYAGYVNCQERVSSIYLDHEDWTRKSIINVDRQDYQGICGRYTGGVEKELHTLTDIGFLPMLMWV